MIDSLCLWAFVILQIVISDNFCCCYGFFVQIFVSGRFFPIFYKDIFLQLPFQTNILYIVVPKIYLVNCFSVQLFNFCSSFLGQFLCKLSFRIFFAIFQICRHILQFNLDKVRRQPMCTVISGENIISSSLWIQNNLKGKLFCHKCLGDNTGARYPEQGTLAKSYVLCVVRLLKVCELWCCPDICPFFSYLGWHW